MTTVPEIVPGMWPEVTWFQKGFAPKDVLHGLPFPQLVEQVNSPTGSVESLVKEGC